MLTITFGDEEFYDEVTETFSRTKPVKLDIEHSLVSLSKWESKYKTPFLVDKKKSSKELLDYVLFMVITPGFNPEQITRLSESDITAAHHYINANETATTFGTMPTTQGLQTETITSELIYYWMVAFNVPWEAQHWHLSRLFALIRICNLKQQKPKKRTTQEIAMMQREENSRRLAESGTPG